MLASMFRHLYLKVYLSIHPTNFPFISWISDQILLWPKLGQPEKQGTADGQDTNQGESRDVAANAGNVAGRMPRHAASTGWAEWSTEVGPIPGADEDRPLRVAQPT